MNRLEALQTILEPLSDELLIVSTGFLSRDVFFLKDRPENFYMCGSMGNAFPIGMGIAMNSTRQVIVISGDGAALMSLGSLAVGNHLNLRNMKHFIIDNGMYGSTGGQQTCSKELDFSQFGQTEVIQVEDDLVPSPRITLEPQVILNRFIQSIQNP